MQQVILNDDVVIHFRYKKYSRGHKRVNACSWGGKKLAHDILKNELRQSKCSK